MPASPTHLVLIPSYNPGPGVLATVRAARAQWNPVWVVVDGSSDGSAEQLQALCIAFSSPYLGKNAPLFARPNLPLDIRIRRGRRFPAQKDAGDLTAQIEQFFRTELGASGASTATGATAS